MSDPKLSVEEYIPFCAPPIYLTPKEEKAVKHERELPFSLATHLFELKSLGAFKSASWGEEKEEEGFEVVWLFLHKIFKRTVLSEKDNVHLRANDLKKEFGAPNSKGTNPVYYYAILKFCKDQNLIVQGKSYKVGEVAKGYCINSLFLTELLPVSIQLDTTLSNRKINTTHTKFKEWQLTRFNGTARGESMDVVRKNMLDLAFISTELDKILFEFFNFRYSLVEKKINAIKNRGSFSFFDHFSTACTGNIGNTGRREGKRRKKKEKERRKGEEERENRGRRDHIVGDYYTPSKKESLPENIKKARRDELCRDTEEGDIVKISNIVVKDNIHPNELMKIMDINNCKLFYRQKRALDFLVSCRLGTYESARYVWCDGKGERLYSLFGLLNGELRWALRYYNWQTGEYERLVSLDGKTFQPWCLCMTIYGDYVNKGQEVPDDVIKLLELIENKDLYYAVVEFAGMKPTKENREKIKKEFMIDIYKGRSINVKLEKKRMQGKDFGKSNNYSRQPFKHSGRFLLEKYPTVWQWILDNRGEELKSKLPVMMQKKESDFFVAVAIPELTKIGVWCLPIHDCIVVREKDAEAVKEYLEGRIMQHFNGRKPIIDRENLWGKPKSKKGAINEISDYYPESVYDEEDCTVAY